MKHIEQNGIYLHPTCPAQYKDVENVTARVQYNKKGKGNVHPCTGRIANRGRRSIALPFHDLSIIRG